MPRANGKAAGHSSKPSLLKQSSLPVLISSSSTPPGAPVAQPIRRIDTHRLGPETQQDSELVHTRVRPRHEGMCLPETPTIGPINEVQTRPQTELMRAAKQEIT
ncbi:hypothetical protein WMY93_016484 [Mugilogobius chulae]|uniref:Uncharacterized protein n=1 Tax=Mugilogobius chulae TaxID=88201 RepID=A0AAW0NQE7_9GOBI